MNRNNISCICFQRYDRFVHIQTLQIITSVQRKTFYMYSVGRAKFNAIMTFPINGQFLICRKISIKMYYAFQLVHSHA